ncbi:MAG: hypothetical protein Unbinned3818contig1000_11 [Prokaryotic dsDNA virus sp.]|nr:hypothetical protein [Phycisphaerae bacterium]QDP45940.1 MAG: hypothetical protein Unbinned3818contig1000_11 [Prokaryotic dsDNA virus sp.]|tara:strand:+ start:3717 stop:3929 length:213 start_codon:yes stop_codon:yes gene_type:complete
MTTDNQSTKPELITALRQLADDMETIGAALDYYGGFDYLLAEHGKEILGAALIARGWADGMEGEHELGDS